MSKKMRLKDLGCKDITLYNAVANYGYKFRKNNIKYDLRHMTYKSLLTILCSFVIAFFILSTVVSSQIVS